MNLLVLTPLVPYPPHDGDKLRLYHLLVELKRRGHKIDLFCLTRVAEDISKASELLGLCRCVHVERLTDFDLFFNGLGALLTGRSFNVFSYFSPRFRDALRAYRESEEGKRVDVVLAHRLRMAPYAFEEGPKKPVVLELTDSMTLMTESLRSAPGIRLSRKLAAVWDRGVIADEETNWVNLSARAVLVSPMDSYFLQNQLKGTKGFVRTGRPFGPSPLGSVFYKRPEGNESKLAVIPNGVTSIKGNMPRPAIYPARVPIVAFVGNMGYPPNEEGAIWFLKKVWPLVKASVPNAVFAAAGGHPRDVLKRMENGRDVLVTGYLPTIEPYVKYATVSVAPLNVSTGMQNKVALSLSLGVPVVATPGAVNWLPEKAKHFVAQASTPQEFAHAVIARLRKPRKSRAQAGKARSFIRRNYRWDRAGRQMEGILKSARRRFEDIRAFRLR